MRAWVVMALFLCSACDVKEPEQTTYFDQVISPILTSGCARGPTSAGCHVADAKGNAFGNLDVSTFAGVDKRRDLLQTYGPYLQPTLLLKATPPTQLHLVAFDGQTVDVMHDIKHTGGPIISPTAGAYFTLRGWINNGASEYNSGPAPKQTSTQPCTTIVPSAPGFDPSVDPTNADFAQFRDNVAPVLKSSCAAGNCHGAPSNDLYLTCGDTPEQIRWNYLAAEDYLASRRRVERALAKRPLGPDARRELPRRRRRLRVRRATRATRRSSVGRRRTGRRTSARKATGFMFFAHRVQPVLVKKGCMMVQCHSASMFHDYRLRGGTRAAASRSRRRRTNYELSLAQIALESRRSRTRAASFARTSIDPRCAVVDGATAIGIAIAAGRSSRTSGRRRRRPRSATAKATTTTRATLDTIPAYCVIREWLRRERAAATSSRRSAPSSTCEARAGRVTRMQDFDVYAPGAELHLAGATIDAAGAIVIGAETIAAHAAAGSPRRRPTFDGPRSRGTARRSRSPRARARPSRSRSTR